ncbi:MAG: hydantoinase/oxoprolinase family protein [Kiloniellales bacterium]
MSGQRVRLATDVGGTFTDLVAYDPESGQLITAKTLTTPPDPSQGVLTAIADSGLAARSVAFLIHGGTTVINALTERKGARTALITTQGFRDVLEIGRGNRPDLYNLRFRSPEAFVPRALRFEVGGRIDWRGDVLEPLDEAALTRIVEACRGAGVEAIAIAFLNSYANPQHEERAKAVIAAAWPEVSVTASSEMTRAWREYERSNTAVLNAYVRPVMARYLRRLEDALNEQGFRPPYLAMLSNGGSADFDWAAEQPLQMVESGPAGGLSGAAAVGRAAGIANIISLDIGGTTAKCSLVQGGEPKVGTTYSLERSRINPGYPLLMPVVDIVEIGAGGGSIAWVDEVGSLKVGPQSAGAAPGPACYARGGDQPTVTDAKLLTGVLDPEAFAGGSMPLDVAAAERAMAALASALELSVEEAALAVIRIAEANMINALQLISVQRGHDPRDFALLVSGGGGAMHGAALARELGAAEILVPPHAGIFSAWGMLATVPRLDREQALHSPFSEQAFQETASGFAAMEAAAVAHFDRFAAGTAMTHQAALDLRYLGQEHSVSVPFDAGASFSQLRQDFDAAHARSYTFALPESAVELVGLRLSSRLDWPTLSLQALENAATPEELEVIARRNLLLPEGSFPDCPVYRRAALPIDRAVVGPCLVEEETTTSLVLPGQELRRDRLDLLRIRDIV